MKPLLRLLWIFVLLATYMASGHATIFAKMPLDDLRKEAREILLIQVVEGKVVGAGDDLCGVRYVGIVEQSIKGRSKGATVEFGYSLHLKMGANYLVFLAASPQEADRYVSMNGRYADLMTKYYVRCKPTMPNLTIMQKGSGALEVDSDDGPSEGRMIKVGNLIRLPSTLPSKAVGDERILKLSDFVQYLDSPTKK
jgi:hypothetical protein